MKTSHPRREKNSKVTARGCLWVVALGAGNPALCTVLGEVSLTPRASGEMH